MIRIYAGLPILEKKKYTQLSRYNLEQKKISSVFILREFKALNT